MGLNAARITLVFVPVSGSALMEKCTRSIQPRRMFHKSSLTKGERAIIGGILTNRGKKFSDLVSSHSHAWHFDEKTTTETNKICDHQTLRNVVKELTTEEPIKESKVTKYHSAGKTVIRKKTKVSEMCDPAVCLDVFLPTLDQGAKLTYSHGDHVCGQQDVNGLDAVSTSSPTSQ